MDRLSSDLSSVGDGDDNLGDAPLMFNSASAGFLQENFVRPSISDGLFSLRELDVSYDSGEEALWTMMRPAGRPSFTPPMLREFVTWQELIEQSFGPGKVPLKYLILGSRASGVFCFGGDLELFAQFIQAGNREGLVKYGYRCVEILHRNMCSLNLPILTVGLVQGQALGGGFEALLSFDVIIAERNSTFGLPEIMFGLFPGMGAHAILSRKLGTARAEQLILSNETYTAEQMYDWGLVHHLAEPGKGIEAVREFMARSSRKHSGMVAAKAAMRHAAPIELDELRGIVDLWADAALQLREQDLKLMQRLASAQERLYRAAAL